MESPFHSGLIKPGSWRQDLDLRIDEIYKDEMLVKPNIE
jgi:hypothetical protein